jgi:NAD(P)-dependent dehydrogenase (short-subunit alcohol dehydrogenase family)
MPARFHEKVALVIGGSSGIGLATVRGLLAERGQVLIAARDAARLATIGQELLAAHPGRTAWISGDISEPLSEDNGPDADTPTFLQRLA